MEVKKFRKKWGDRKDGRRIRSLTAMAMVSPYIMVTRNTSSNFFRDTVEITEIEKYIREKRKEGLKNFGIMHVIIAAYVRAVSQRPAVNRFIAGQKIYARDEYIEMSLVVKKEMSADSPDTCIKPILDAHDTAAEIYHKINALIEQNKATAELNNNFDNTAKLFSFIPGVLLKFAVWLLKLLDYFDLLPRKLTMASPFHASFFITSMGSLGIPPIYHHLYDFGNIPVFLAFGSKYRKHEVNADGTVSERKYVDITAVTDERICDGFYYASAFKLMRTYLKNPSVLDEPVLGPVRDVD